jgi:SRSO17 transposase
VKFIAPLPGSRRKHHQFTARHQQAGTAPLHPCLAVDWRPLRRRLAERMCKVIDQAASVVDDTGFPKDGRWSVGVQRPDATWLLCN